MAGSGAGIRGWACTPIRMRASAAPGVMVWNLRCRACARSTYTHSRGLPGCRVPSYGLGVGGQRLRARPLARRRGD